MTTQQPRRAGRPQRRPENHILHHRGKPGPGIAIGDTGRQRIPQLQLSLRLRRRLNPKLGPPGNNHSPERIPTHMRRPRQPLRKPLRHGGLPGSHRPGDHHNPHAATIATQPASAIAFVVAQCSSACKPTRSRCRTVLISLQPHQPC